MNNTLKLVSTIGAFALIGLLGYNITTINNQKECKEDILKAQIDTLAQKAKYYEIMYVETLNAHYEFELMSRRAGMPPPPPPAPAYWPPTKK